MTRLRMKVGAHEFEAEGSALFVLQQFAAWTDLLGGADPIVVSCLSSMRIAQPGRPALNLCSCDPLKDETCGACAMTPELEAALAEHARRKRGESGGLYIPADPEPNQGRQFDVNTQQDAQFAPGSRSLVPSAAVFDEEPGYLPPGPYPPEPA